MSRRVSSRFSAPISANHVYQQELPDSPKDNARDEGKQLLGIFEDAARLHLQQREQPCNRAHVLEALECSMVEHDALYRRLAQ